MSVINGYLVTDCKAEASENIVGANSFYDLPLTWNFTTTDGATTGTATQSTDHPYIGNKSLKVEITSSVTVAGDVTVSSTQEGFTAPRTGKYIFSRRVLDTSTVLQQSGVSYTLQVYKNGVYYKDIVLNSDGLEQYQYGKFNTIAAQISFNMGDVITWRHIFQNVSLLSSPIFYIDGMCVNFEDRNLGVCPIYSKPVDLIAEIPTTDGVYNLTIADGIPTFTEV